MAPLSVPVVTDGPFLFLGIQKGLGLDLLVISALSVLLKKTKDLLLNEELDFSALKHNTQLSFPILCIYSVFIGRG